MQVIVRFTIPVQLYPLKTRQEVRALVLSLTKLVPLKTRQEIHALVLSLTKCGIPDVAQRLICRHILSKHGINMLRDLDYEFGPISDGPVIIKTSSNTYFSSRQ